MRVLDSLSRSLDSKESYEYIVGQVFSNFTLHVQSAYREMHREMRILLIIKNNVIVSSLFLSFLNIFIDFKL